MSSLLGKLQKVGVLHTRGEFTLDVDKAGSKLSRFQFHDEADFLFQMVAGLYRLGAQEVEVRTQAETLTITLDPITLPAEMPAELDTCLLEEFSPWRRLAAATQAILGHAPSRFEWLGKSKSQTYDYLTDECNAWKSVQLREIVVEGLKSALLNRALERLGNAAVYRKHKLTINGNVPIVFPPDNCAIPGQSGWCALDSSVPKAQLHLIVDQMCTDPKTLDLPIPWTGVVYWQGAHLRLDASLASVVEDEHYQQLLTVIPGTYLGCLEDFLKHTPLPVPIGSPQRKLLLDILASGDTPDLAALQERILAVPLFFDIKNQPWSLQALMQRTGPLYYSKTPVSEDVNELILFEKSKEAISVLKGTFLASLKPASPIVLRKLVRDANIERWKNLPSTPLQLPARNWLAERKLSSPLAQSQLGLPDDWSQPGGTVTVYHGGKFLVKRSIPHEEITFEVVCEIEESSIAEPWDDVDEDIWPRLCDHWLFEVEELLKELSNTDSQHWSQQIRNHLLLHLERARHPENSYFAKTLLFRDQEGNLHSIHSLLEAVSKSTTVARIAFHQSLDGIPKTMLPKAIWFSGDGQDVRCLLKVPALRLKDLNFLLDDLKQMRLEANQEKPAKSWRVALDMAGTKGWVEVCSNFYETDVSVVSHGYFMGTYPIGAAKSGLKARVENDELRYNVRLDEKRMGASRWSLLTNQATWQAVERHLLDKLEDSVERVTREERLSQVPEWAPWFYRMIRSGAGREHPALLKIPSFHQRSLEDWLSQTIHWSSQKAEPRSLEEFGRQHPGVSLWDDLNPSDQSIFSAQYGGEWVCQDSWLARHSRFSEFLKKPPIQIGRSDAWLTLELVPPLQGVISLTDPFRSAGCIQWMYQRRLVYTETANLPPGISVQVESEKLELDDAMTSLVPRSEWNKHGEEIREHISTLLVQWLSQPRPALAHLVSLWNEWERTSTAVADKLREQPWFVTSQGTKSWNELLELPSLYLVEGALQMKSAIQLAPNDHFLDHELVPAAVLQSLTSKVANCHDRKKTNGYLGSLLRKQQAQELIRHHQQKLNKLDYKVTLSEPFSGEFAWIAQQAPETTLLVEDRALELVGAPPGWTGYLETQGPKIRRVSGKEQAELSKPQWKQFYVQVLPALLQRIEAGHLRRLEIDNIAAFALVALHHTSPQRVDPDLTALVDARWIPCADGTRVSLHQLFLEAEERQQITYWTRTYRLTSEVGEQLTPILSTPILLEIVQRWTGRKPLPRQKPLLYRDVKDLTVPKLQNMRQVLEGLGRWIGKQAKRPFKALKDKTPRPQVEPIKSVLMNKVIQPVLDYQEKKKEEFEKRFKDEEERLRDLETRGAPLMKALRRQASLLLQGPARRETLRVLERAKWSLQPSRKLWTLGNDPPLLLYGTHPRLAPILGQEPPAQFVISLLLALVSTLNAHSAEFTDEMEVDFLDKLTGELVQTYRDVIPSRG